MSKSPKISRNSSSVSIRYAPSNKELPDANKYEPSEIPVIDVEGLRSIRRIVLTIKQRIAEAEQTKTGHDHQRLSARGPGGSKTDCSNCAEDPNGEEAEKK